MRPPRKRYRAAVFAFVLSASVATFLGAPHAVASHDRDSDRQDGGHETGQQDGGHGGHEGGDHGGGDSGGVGSDSGGAAESGGHDSGGGSDSGGGGGHDVGGSDSGSGGHDGTDSGDGGHDGGSSDSGSGDGSHDGSGGSGDGGHDGADRGGADGGGTDSGGSGDGGHDGGGSDSGSGGHDGTDSGGSGDGGHDGGGSDSGSGGGGSDDGSHDGGGHDGTDDHGGISGDSNKDGSASGSDSGGSNSASAGDDISTGGSVSGRVDLARDRDGREFRAHELVVVGDASQFAALHARGLNLVAVHALSADRLSVARILLPESVVPEAALAELKAALPDATFDLNSIYRVAGNLPRGIRSAAVTRDAYATRSPRRPRSAPRAGLARMAGIVGVIDTGVDPSFSNLSASIVSGRNFAGKAEGTHDLHGTLVASIVASEGAHLMTADVFSYDVAGQPAASADAIAKAIDWLVSQRVPVINLSLSGPPNSVIARELKIAQDRGAIIVAAAGNDGPAAPPTYPAAYGAVIAVTATDRAGNVYRYANRGSYIMFAAPGVDVATHSKPPAVASVSGTSYAAPVVSRLLAAQFSSPDASGVSPVIDWLRKRAKDLGPPGRDPIYGYGLISE